MIPLTQEDMQNHSNIERLDNTRSDDRMEVDEDLLLDTDIAVARSLQDQEVSPERNSAREPEHATRRTRILSSTPLTATSSTFENTLFSSEVMLASDHTISSPENPLTMPGGHLIDESPLFLPEPPPPNYASAVKQGQAKPLCVICEKRDAYNDGIHAYPTCGNQCARKLESLQGFETRSNGHWYSSTQERGFGSNSNRYDFRARSPPIKMCIVCKARPRYEKGGKSYDTCGLTCAAKLEPSKSADKCEFCQIKPKTYFNHKQVPYCSIVCRDKAQALATAVANSSTCATCLICWRTTKVGDRDDFCSPNCHAVHQANVPNLLEIPRGHVSFKKISDLYLSSWKDTKYPCPQIKRMYMVGLSDATHASHLAYQGRVEQARGLIRSKKSNTKPRWLGIKRDCLLGDTGSTEPCAIPTCFLCSLIRAEIHPQVFAKGIISTSLLDRAIARSSRSREKASSKLVVLANVVLGQEAELAVDENLTSLPPGAHSFRLLQRRGGLISSKITHDEESIVFTAEAVRPLYIISYESN